MYGLVNRAVEDMVVANFGEGTWTAIKERAGFHDEGFMSMQNYDDAVTYNMVGAASEVLGIEPSSVLEAFGEYWVMFTGREGYGHLFEMGGRSLSEFLENLNNMHTRIAVAMSDARMPSFQVEKIDANSLRLHYVSTREGLAPLVVGILRGLAKVFNTSVTVAQDKFKNRGDAHDEFVVHMAA